MQSVENEGLQARRIPIDTSGAWRQFIAVMFILVVMTALGGYAWHQGARLEDLTAVGYPGIFVLMFTSGAGTFFPNPYQAVVPIAGALWTPWLVGLIAGLGNGTGELVTYSAGRTGSIVLAGRRTPPGWSTVKRWVERYGFFTILVIAAVPNPIFDAVALISGSARYPVKRFWLATATGNSLKYIVYAYFGGTLWSWLT